jgi:branched-chain amino acid transport system permease protein
MNVVERLIRQESNGVLSRWSKLGLAGAGFVVFALAPIFVNMGYMNLLGRIFVFALFVVAYDFVFGYGGIFSFGHAAMFGTGSYVAALLITEISDSALLAIVLAFLCGVIVAVVMAIISLRGSDIYFAILTLVVAQLLYFAAFDDLPAAILGVNSVTNGDSGIFGVARFSLFGTGVKNDLIYLYLIFLVVAVSLTLLIRLANSPFGRTLQGIRENEERMEMVGYNVYRYKIVAFGLSGGFSAVAGCLYVPLQTIAHPTLLHWQITGDGIIMILVGGIGTLWGPILGAAAVLSIEEILAGGVGWKLLLGAVYLGIVIFFKDGLAGIFNS